MRKILFVLATISVGLVLSVLLIEGGLRLVGFTYPIFFVPDPVGGGHMWPNLKAWWTQEGVAFVEVNSLGYRDKEHRKEKGEREFRIAFLGDSYTEAVQVDFEEAYWSVVRRKLSHCRAFSGREIVPMNFGISGYGTAQAMEVLRHVVWDYDPDLVVLGFVANDFNNNHPAWGGSDIKPFYVFDEEGSLVLDDSFLSSPSFKASASRLRHLRREVAQRSRLLQLLLKIRADFQRKRALQESLEEVEDSVGGRFSKPPEEPHVQEAWRVTEGMLAMLDEDVRSRGVDFILLITTTGHQVHPDPEYKVRRRELLGVESLLYWNDRIEDFAQSKGIVSVSLAESFREFAEQNQTCLHGFDNAVPCGGHWNQEGHRLAGERLAEVICELEGVADARPGAHPD